MKSSQKRRESGKLPLREVFSISPVATSDSFCGSRSHLCILFTIIGRHPTWATVSPPQPVSVTVDDFDPQVANATSSRERNSNLASAASPLLARQLGTAFHHQFKNQPILQLLNINLKLYCFRDVTAPALVLISF